MVKLNSSYIARLITLSIVYFERIWRLPLRYFRIKGSRIILRDSNNNFLVKLNKNTILGRKDELLHISNDKVLLFNILNYGVYEKPTIDFFREFTNSKKGIWTFVDIGANCGLITLGVCRCNESVTKIIAVEPIFQNRIPLVKNLANVTQVSSVLAFGLDMERGFREILIPTDQFGSATLNKLGVGTGAFSRQTIRLETPGFMYQEWMHGEERFLLKIDIEGMDVEILNHFPSDLFKRVDALSFEVDQRSLMFPAELMKLFDLLGEAGLTLNSNYGDSNPEEISSANLIDELSQRASYNSNVFFSRRD